MKKFFFVSKLLGLSLIFLSLNLFAQALNAKTDYFIKGKSILPWELSLQFRQVKLENNTGKTLRSSLVARPASKNGENDAIRLTWKPKGIKNEWGGEDKNILTATLTNFQKHTDLAEYKKDGVLLIDVKVLKAPRNLVELTMECAWNWKCRSTIPLKNILTKLPKKKWISLPIPLKCFDDGKFDFSKVTTSFMLYTGGKMDLEIGDVRVVNFPNLNAKC